MTAISNQPVGGDCRLGHQSTSSQCIYQQASSCQQRSPHSVLLKALGTASSAGYQALGLRKAEPHYRTREGVDRSVQQIVSNASPIVRVHNSEGDRFYNFERRPLVSCCNGRHRSTREISSISVRRAHEHGCSGRKDSGGADEVAGAAKILIDPCLSDNPSWDKGWIGSHAGEDSTQEGGR